MLRALEAADGDWFDPTVIRTLSEWNLANALRPCDEFDVDVDPRTYRGTVLAYYDAIDEAHAQMKRSMVGRLLLRLRRLTR